MIPALSISLALVDNAILLILRHLRQKNPMKTAITLAKIATTIKALEA